MLDGSDFAKLFTKLQVSRVQTVVLWLAIFVVFGIWLIGL